MLSALKTPTFKQPKENVVRWDTWRKGLNTLLRETEIGGDEVVQATNLLLVGSGVPTKRWGSATAFLAGATGYSRFIFPIKDANDNVQILAMTDSGILVKQSGTSYTPITGASFASGYNLEASQLGGNVYLVNGQRSWVRYNFNSLTNFPTLAIPSNVLVTQLSSASGANTWSWRITAVSSSGGETVGSPIALATLSPQDLTTTLYNISWTPTSAASGDLVGYNVYRGTAGSELWVGGTPPTITSFRDGGQFVSIGESTRLTPVADTTGGPIAKFIIRYQDRLVLAGIPGAPTKVLISGRYPYQERFDWFGGGGYVLIEPDSGEDIMGISVYYRSATSTQTIVVFKEHSVWEVSLDTITFGSYVILNPTYRLLTLSQGCTSHRSIVPVENDLMFINRRGMYMLRYEPQLINIINANEISAKIRPFFQGLAYSDITSGCGLYIDKKYICAFPVSQQIIMFDRERLCFMGPWTPPFGVNHWAKYVDATGVERWLASDASDAFISQFSAVYPDDKGTPMRTIFRTKKDAFGDWTIFKTINELYVNFRNVQGSINVNVYLEQRSGATVVAKAFTITSSSGASGFGIDQFGLNEFGLSGTNPLITSTELPKKSFLYKVARTMQIEVITTHSIDSYELLGILMVGINQSRGNSPSSWIV